MPELITSRQIIFDYNEVRRAIPGVSDFGVEDYMALKADVENLRACVTELLAGVPQFGSGSPESVVTSNFNRTYFDTSVSPAIMWVNPESGVDTGWLEVS